MTKSKKFNPFYVVSALKDNSSPIGILRRWETEEEAIDHAKDILERRAVDDKGPITFHVLKVTAVIEPQKVPVKVTKLNRR